MQTFTWQFYVNKKTFALRSQILFPKLGNIVNNAPKKANTFSSHCLKHVAWCIEMLPYSTASYSVKVARVVNLKLVFTD